MTTPDNLRPERIDPTKRIGEEAKVPSTPSRSFETFMQQPNPLTQSPTQSLSPFDLAHGQTVLPATPTPETLMAQAKMAQTTLGDVSTQLSTPNLKLKQAHKYLLKNKLTDANAHLRAANIKLGAETPEEKALPPGTGPVAKFLNFVTDGQNQLDSSIRQLSAIKDKGMQMNPADFLLVQIKLNKAQQEIEYSSVLLSKVIDDMKTLMNIQL